MKRTMELFDAIADVLGQDTLDQLEIACEELIEVEWDMEVVSYTKGSPAVLWGDNAHPAEPCEYEVDMTPIAVAFHFTRRLVQFLPAALAKKAVITKIWDAIADCEQKWQDDNLDEAVHDMMWGNE